MGCVMHPDDGRLIARLQKLTTELLADKRLGRWRAETVNELYRARLSLRSGASRIVRSIVTPC